MFLQLCTVYCKWGGSALVFAFMLGCIFDITRIKQFECEDVTRLRLVPGLGMLDLHLHFSIVFHMVIQADGQLHLLHM
jgi:hypothetical protein